ncbi:MAG: UbiD family decarboxylase [Dehalococcoidia bacterium]
MPFEDLRQFINHLGEHGKLARVTREVDPRYEIAAYLRKAVDTQGPALWFENVKGHTMPVVGGLFTTRELALTSLGFTPGEAIESYLAALEHLVPPKLVSSGPCQEVTFTGEQVDLSCLPIPTYSAGDAGPYITAGVVVSRDPVDGSKNASIYRIQLKGKNRLGILSTSQHHLGIQYQKAEAQGRPLEVAIALGCSPAILQATQWEAPLGVDELGLAGALLGHPLEVVKGITVDLEVPASAEIIIEGRVLPGVREEEGPFGEYTGYYTGSSPKPVIEVSAITHRKEPLFHAFLCGTPPTENHVIKLVPLEASYYAMLKGKFPGVRAVRFPEAGGVGLMIVVAMEQRAPYEARSVIMSIFGSQRNKVVIVVDDDIDIFNMDQVMWAVATRSQADHDLIVVPRLAGGQLDPSAPDLDGTCGMGIDATRPFGVPFPEVVTVPGVDRVPDLRALGGT